MKYDLNMDGGVAIITPQGSLEGGPETFEIKDEVKSRLGQGDRRFILDMIHVGFVNSTGIGMSVSCLSSILNAQAQLVICNLSERARRAFEVTGVLTLFQVYETRAEALAALRKG